MGRITIQIEKKGRVTRHHVTEDIVKLINKIILDDAFSAMITDMLNDDSTI